MNTTIRAIALVAACLTMAPAGALYGQVGGVTDAITVYGKGEVLAKPSMMEIDLRATGRAELTGDAIVKYRDSRWRLMSAFKEVNKENLAMEELNLALTSGSIDAQMQMALRGQVANVKSEVVISRTIRVPLKNIQDTSDSFAEIPLSVRLIVRFSIVAGQRTAEK